MGHFLHSTEGIGQIVGKNPNKLFSTTNDAVAVPLIVKGPINNVNLKESLVVSVDVANSDCLVEIGDPVTFWEQGNSASGKSQTYINVAGKCMNCENPCPFSVNSLSEQAKDFNVKTKRLGVKQNISRKEIQSVEIADNGDVKTTPSPFFEI